MNAKHYIEKIRACEPPALRDGETPDEYFRRCEIRHFSFGETLQLRRAKKTAPPPPDHWIPRIIPALWFAEALRSSLGNLVKHPVPIVVGNGFRPSPRHPDLRGYPDLNRQVGGARRSLHISYRALDLDPADSVHRQYVVDIATDLYLELKDDVVIGLGTYKWSRRIHVDIGPNDLRSWGDRVRDAVWGPGRRVVKGKRER